MTKRIDIGKDFSDVPAGRFPDDGPFNGEVFRKTQLVPPLRSGETVLVVLDNTEGFGSSFLEEAFGGLIRCEGFSRSFIQNHVDLIAEKARSKRYKRLIESYISNAIAQA